MSFILFIKTFLLSYFTTLLNPTNIHNSLKFKQIFQIWYCIKQDNIPGEYVEFGVFKGKSLYHSWRCAKNHNLYTNENFYTSYQKVEKTFKSQKNIQLIKGFFNTTLNSNEMQKIKKISFAFIDCDIYESAVPIFSFLKERISIGGFIMIDDFSSIDKNNNSIHKAWLEQGSFNEDFIFFSNYSNGQVFRKIR